LNVQTAGQKMARAAHEQVAQRKPDDAYIRFAREFPTLVHSCGLAQALAFALAKSDHHRRYAEDLAKVLAAAGHEQVGSAEEMARRIREDLWVTQYIRLSRDALTAAVWLRRAVEAAGLGSSSARGG
jgi:CRISPR-associated protein Cmr5